MEATITSWSNPSLHYWAALAVNMSLKARWKRSPKQHAPNYVTEEAIKTAKSPELRVLFGTQWRQEPEEKQCLSFKACGGEIKAAAAEAGLGKTARRRGSLSWKRIVCNFAVFEKDGQVNGKMTVNSARSLSLAVTQIHMLPWTENKKEGRKEGRFLKWHGSLEP